MHVVSKGSIDAVCFDALATLVRGDESIALELGDIDDLVAVVTALAEHVRSTRGSQSNIEKAVAGGALTDFDSTVTVEIVAPRSAPAVDADAGVVVARGKRGPRAAPAAAASPTAELSVVTTPVVAPAVEAAPEAPSAPAAEAEVVVDKTADRRPAAEVITQAVIAYLEMRVRPQSFERILRAVRKADGVPDDVGKNLMELLKRLTKKGTLLRTPTGGFSIAGA